jgi:hypothetical protein
VISISFVGDPRAAGVVDEMVQLRCLTGSNRWSVMSSPNRPPNIAAPRGRRVEVGEAELVDLDHAVLATGTPATPSLG